MSKNTDSMIIGKEECPVSDAIDANGSVTEAQQSSLETHVFPTTPSKSNDESFTRANVEALGNLIHLVDSDKDTGLDMFCYIKCFNDSPDMLKQCRGVVFHKDEIVMKAFPYNIEYNDR